MDNEDDDRLGDTMLSMWDVVAVVIYFILVISAGIFSLFRPNRNTVSGYFLAGRFITWLPVGASLFASNIGSEHFIGLAGSGAAAGIAVGAFELNALLLLQLLGWVFLPVFVASKVTTLPEYMGKRFGGRRIRTCLALFSIMLYIFTKISVNMYSGAIFLQQALRWQNLYVCIITLLVLTAMFTAVGGLAAVIYTDSVQFFVMIGGSMALSIVALNEVGGLSALYTSYMQAIPTPLIANSSCGLPRKDAWVMLRSADPAVSDLPWPGFLLGQTPASIWYWCADQMMVQRAMAAKSLSHAKGATLFAGMFKLLPLFLLVIPGMVSRVLYTNEVACVDPDTCFEFCGSRISCSNSAYPKLVFALLPGGLRGVMLAVMLSALISDVTSIFNSAATLFTVDLWRYFRPAATVREQLVCARVFILFLLGVSVAWVPIIESIQGGEMYIYIQSVAAYLSPPIAAVYCMALFNPKMNEPGAFWGLMIGFVVGGIRMTLDFCYSEPLCYEEDTRPAFIQIHYMYFATLLFWLTLLVSFFVSIATPPGEDWRLTRATYWSRHSVSRRQDEENEDDEEVTRKTEYMMTESDLERRADNGEDHLVQFADTEAKAILGEETNISNCDAEVCVVKSRRVSTKHVTEDSLALASDVTKQKAVHDPSSPLGCLYQEPWERRLLNTMLVIISLLCLALFVVFSVNPFTEEQVRQLQRDKLQEMGLTNYSFYQL